MNADGRVFADDVSQINKPTVALCFIPAPMTRELTFGAKAHGFRQLEIAELGWLIEDGSPVN